MTHMENIPETGRKKCYHLDTHLHTQNGFWSHHVIWIRLRGVFSAGIAYSAGEKYFVQLVSIICETWNVRVTARQRYLWYRFVTY